MTKITQAQARRNRKLHPCPRKTAKARLTDEQRASIIVAAYGKAVLARLRERRERGDDGAAS